MAHWFKIAVSANCEDTLNRRVKEIIRTHPFFLKLFKMYDVPIDRIDNLTLRFGEFTDKHAESNSKEIVLDSKLFADGCDIVDNIHYVVHELVHWLTRQREKEFYFTDPEEIEAFSMSIAYELMRGKSAEEIAQVYYPIIVHNFSDDENGKAMFEALMKKGILKAKDLA
jgi:hypothetical protein